MNKTKRELYEENKKYRETLATYSQFWECDAIQECTKKLTNTKRILLIFSIVLLIISAFFLGMGC